MPKYIVFRTVGKLSEVDIEACGFDVRGSHGPDAGGTLDPLLLSAAEGKIYCEYEAPSAELIFEHARRAGIPIDDASEVVRELEPAMFR